MFYEIMFYQIDISCVFMWHKKLWKDIKDDMSIRMFEHPLHQCFIEKDEYINEFGTVLEKLDGETMCDYIDFYFKKRPFFTGYIKIYR